MASTYSESTSGTPEFYNTAVQNLLNAGQSAYDATTSAAPPQLSIAGFDPMQTQAFDLAQSNLGNWQPAIQSGFGALSQALGSAQFDPNQVQQFLNPYLSGVVDEIARLGNKNFNENVAPAVANQFGGLGQFGSARQAMALGKAAGDTQANILGQQASALKESYDSALGGYTDFAQLAANTGLDASKTYTTLGSTQNQLGVTDYGTLLSAGQAQQTQQQAVNNQLYQNQLAQQNYPWEQLNNWKNTFGVSTPQQSSSWSTQLKAGGLVKLASGGMPDEWEAINNDYAAGQPSRDALRRETLIQELLGDPNNPALAEELAFEGLDLNQLHPSPKSPPSTGTSNNDLMSTRTELMKKLLNKRLELASTIEGRLQAEQEPGWMDQTGRAMLEAAAQGPANYGQLIGRAGSAYFGNQDKRRASRNELELAKLALEDQVLPEGGSLTGSSGVERFKFMRGKDGTVWAVSDLDPTRRHVVQAGNYSKEIMSAAEKAADSDLRDVTFDNANQRAQARQDLIHYYSGVFSQGFNGMEGDLDVMDAPQLQSPPASPAPTVTAGGGISGPRPAPGTLQTPQEVKESEAVGAAMGKAYEELQTESKVAQDQSYYYDQLEHLLKGVRTGKLTPLGTELAGWAHAIGWDVDDNLGNKQAATAIGNQLALQLRNPAGGAGMPGALSNQDREFLLKSVPGLATSSEGIAQLIMIKRKMAQRSQDVARLAREYRASNPRKTFDEGFYRQLADWAKENPLFSDTEMRAIRPKRSIEEIMKEHGGN